MSYLLDIQIFNCYINRKDIFHSQNFFTITGHFVGNKRKSNDRLKKKIKRYELLIGIYIVCMSISQLENRIWSSRWRCPCRINHRTTLKNDILNLSLHEYMSGEENNLRYRDVDVLYAFTSKQLF